MALKQGHMALLRKTAVEVNSGKPQLFSGDIVGDFQASILATVARLSPDATATTILDYLITTAEEAADVAQTYAVLKVLTSHGHVEVLTDPKPERGRKPPTRYGITDKGHQALQAKLDRMELLKAYIKPTVPVAVTEIAAKIAKDKDKPPGRKPR